MPEGRRAVLQADLPHRLIVPVSEPNGHQAGRCIPNSPRVGRRLGQPAKCGCRPADFQRIGLTERRPASGFVTQDMIHHIGQLRAEHGPLRGFISEQQPSRGILYPQDRGGIQLALPIIQLGRSTRLTDHSTAIGHHGKAEGQIAQ